MHPIVKQRERERAIGRQRAARRLRRNARQFSRGLMAVVEAANHAQYGMSKLTNVLHLFKLQQKLAMETMARKIPGIKWETARWKM